MNEIAAQPNLAEDVLAVWHVVKGEPTLGAECGYGREGQRFATPKLDLDNLVWSRLEPGPAFDVPVAEIIDLLVEVGKALREDTFGHLAEACESLSTTVPHNRAIFERAYDEIWRLFDGEQIWFQLQNELGGSAVVDGWVPGHEPDGRVTQVRAFPPRLVHILAGNAPGLGPASIVRCALTKGVHLFKLPSNDLFTTPAVLRTMAQLAPKHPVVQSFSAVYWQGGDEAVESVLFRPQFFDKLVAWGGEAAIRGALKYIGPGFELVSFDPKTSISFIGREVFDSEDNLRVASVAAATDATLYNQEACVASRFQFIEGELADIDRYCETLVDELGKERPTATSSGVPVPADVREELEILRLMPGQCRIWGSYDGSGLVIRSAEPIDMHPNGKIVNVVPVATLRDAVQFSDVATQTVGVYPASRKAEVRDALASAGVQRVVVLGSAGRMPLGFPHDGFYPLHRFVRWINDEG
ncbi:long-chain-fatty-acyl-CoA reductase [Mycobacterium colombiense]|uniref:acyl-CoA reductase n=1 Tax=Mycobacterium colombiense TaxID=339268 RepID=UPI0007EEF802|nr:acyl-CoA reductase [Mycobacterium colombiense]OBK68569.1 long-chain-fatty-acyl-CoA reductase [Mycobacterium colombiense]